jgi:RimJ/RimL family protein N-acetyltransferase
MSALPDEIRTRRLVLRAPVDRDVPDIVRGLRNRNVSRWLGRVPHPYVPRHARSWLATNRRARQEGRDLNFAIALASRPDRVVGGIGCHHLRSAQPVIGYWLAEAHWGKGYMSEALGGLLEALVAMAPEIRPIATAMRDNRGSIGVLTKAGFVRERRPRILMNAARKRKFVVAAFRWRGPAANSGVAGKGSGS